MSKLEVVELETDEVVRTIDTTGRSERVIEKTLRGLSTNMDRERFVVRAVDDEDAPVGDDEQVAAENEDPFLSRMAAPYRMGEDQ